MRQRINSSLLLFVCFRFISAQVDVKFVEHLNTAGLFHEQLRYLNTRSAPSDSVSYFKARLYLQYFNDSLFLSNYSGSQAMCLGDTTLLKGAGIKFLRGDNASLRKHWFALLPETHHQGTLDRLRLVYYASEHPGEISENTLPAELRASFMKYRRICLKSPLLAASLSAIVPGSGKLYAGKKKSALAALLINAGYAAQTMESINKLGPAHPFTIVNMCAFSVFYLSNIYGAYRSVIELRAERKKQFLADATYFYN